MREPKSFPITTLLRTTPFSAREKPLLLAANTHKELSGGISVAFFFLSLSGREILDTIKKRAKKQLDKSSQVVGSVVPSGRREPLVTLVRGH